MENEMEVLILERYTRVFSKSTMFDLFIDGELVDTQYSSHRLFKQAIAISAKETADKIKQAFNDLRKNGIEARFGINQDTKAGAEWGDKVDGKDYVFCRTDAVKGGLPVYNEICIYHSLGKDNDTTVAEELVFTLKLQGLKVEWCGNHFKAVTVKGEVQWDDVKFTPLED
jgi:hypothetical protein